MCTAVDNQKDVNDVMEIKGDKSLMYCCRGIHPPGGFLSFFSNPAEQSSPQPVDSQGKMVRRQVHAPKSSLRSQPLINLDNGEDDGNGARTDRRLQWMKEEEVRLVSCMCIFIWYLT